MDIMDELLNASPDFDTKISLNEEEIPIREKWEYTSGSTPAPEHMPWLGGSSFRSAELVSSEPITGEELNRIKDRIQAIIDKWVV